MKDENMNTTNHRLEIKIALCLAAVLAIAGCATKRPMPVTSQVISTNTFVNAPEWAGFKEPVENMVRAAYANDCDVRITLTKVDGNRAEVRRIEIHPSKDTQ